MVSTPPLAVTKPRSGKIETLEELSAHLCAAAYVELSTVPMYLYAAYSMRTRGYSQWALGKPAQSDLIGVVIEEMQHMALARNVLVAIGRGDDLRVYARESVPTYPAPMAHRMPPLTLSLRRLSSTQVQTFMEVELPESEQKQVEAVDIVDYHSLGEFYKYIEDGITYLSTPAAGNEQIKWADLAADKLWQLQYHRGYWNQNGGAQQPLLVTDEKTAIAALRVIVEQGEGAPHDRGHIDPIYPPPKIGEHRRTEDSHYTKFLRIRQGVDGVGVVKDDNGQEKYTIDSPEVVRPVIDNPTIEQVNDVPVRKLMVLSNAAYCYVLALLDKIYRTRTTVDGTQPFRKDERYGYERGFIAAMQGVLYPIADLLMRTPFQDGDLKVGPVGIVNAGPPFQHHEFTVRTESKKTGQKRGRASVRQFWKPREDLAALCREVTAFYPELGGDDGVERQIRLLPDFELDLPPAKG
ncbi:ferritin-like domain-containing protein [Streptomyces aureoversilis]|uniref:Ferritin-like protein n=1 Tax=Streptomyces aureoversilis TaxID=67277 RepID=A0ABW0A7S2_9ACTN